MPTDSRLRADLLKQLGSVTPQRLSQLVAQVKRLYGPMTTEEGAYVLAHQRGLDLTRYLDQAVVDRIRGMLPTGGAQAPAPPTPATGARARRAATKAVRIGPHAPVINPMLPTSIAKDAVRMAELYPKLYVLENSLRYVIGRVLAANHGKEWWSTRAPSDVGKKVQDRRDKEKKAPWHGKRGGHEIFYSDFGDLKKIISNNWSDFSGIFPDQPWITGRLEELEPARNTLAHHNPVPEHEQKRLEVYVEDWDMILNARRDLIP
jgi:hypothetical protein